MTHMSGLFFFYFFMSIILFSSLSVLSWPVVEMETISWHFGPLEPYFLSRWHLWPGPRMTDWTGFQALTKCSVFFSLWEQQRDQLYSVKKKNPGVPRKFKVSVLIPQSCLICDWSCWVFNCNYLSKEKCWIWFEVLNQDTVVEWVCDPSHHKEAVYPFSAKSFQLNGGGGDSNLNFPQSIKVLSSVLNYFFVAKSQNHLYHVLGVEGWGWKLRRGRRSAPWEQMLLPSCHEGFWASVVSGATCCLFILLF